MVTMWINKPSELINQVPATTASEISCHWWGNETLKEGDEIQNDYCQHLNWCLREYELLSGEEIRYYEVQSLYKQMKMKLKVFFDVESIK